MNREETKMAIAVMQAFVEGQEIECKAKQGGAWIDSFASWNFEDLYYRVKPKPREFWVNTRNQRAIAKEIDAREDADEYGGEVIHVREVMKN